MPWYFGLTRFDPFVHTFWVDLFIRLLCLFTFLNMYIYIEYIYIYYIYIYIFCKWVKWVRVGTSGPSLSSGSKGNSPTLTIKKEQRHQKESVQ